MKKTQKALDSISINIPAKSSVAFIGESGSGKTTLADIITIDSQIYSGHMYIDGVSSIKLKSQVGVVKLDTYHKKP